MAKTDLNLMVIFDAIMRERSVSIAAEVLNQTQPSVSKAINRMRHQWQDPLFVKKGRGVEPTPFAITLWNNISEPLAHIERQLSQPKFDPNKTPSTLRVALTDGMTHIFWPHIRSIIESKANAIDLHAVPFKGDGESLLLSASADLVFDYYEDKHPHILSEQLFYNHFTCVMSNQHPLAYQPLELENFISCEHLLVSLSGDASGLVDQALTAQGLTRRVAMTVNSFSGALELISQSNLICVIPQRILRSSSLKKKLVEKPIPITVPPVPISIAWHKRRSNHPPLMWLIVEIRHWLDSQKR